MSSDEEKPCQQGRGKTVAGPGSVGGDASARAGQMQRAKRVEEVAGDNANRAEEVLGLVMEGRAPAG